MLDRDQLREAIDRMEPHVTMSGRMVIAAARLVADPDTLTITKVDGQWPVPIMESINGWRDGYASVPELLDVLLEGQPK